MADPASPDFDQIARRLTDAIFETIEGIDDVRRTGATVIMTRAWFTDQLRQVWNARGAADCAKVDVTVPAGLSDQIARALRTLDR